MKLTTANIASAAPGHTLRDPTVPGLQLKVWENKKSYYLYYRTTGHRERRPKIGEHPNMTLGQARAIAKEMLAKVALGEDPSGERKALRTAPRVADLAERVIETHLPRRKLLTQDMYLRLIRKYILPAIGKLTVSEVTHRDMEKLHAKIGKKAPVQANRTMAVASKMFRLAEKWGMRPLGTNPCQYVERFRENPRRRYMTKEEARAVASALAELRERRRFSVDFILLLVFTGARKGEITNARWEHYKGDRLELPTELVKNSARTIFLPPMAQTLIEALPRTSGTIIQVKTPDDCWQTIREMTGLHDLRIHDLRHTYASVLLDQGYGLEQIGQLLGHTQAQTTRRYAHLMDEKAIAASESAGAQLGNWMSVT